MPSKVAGITICLDGAWYTVDYIRLNSMDFCQGDLRSAQVDPSNYLGSNTFEALLRILCSVVYAVVAPQKSPLGHVIAPQSHKYLPQYPHNTTLRPGHALPSAIRSSPKPYLEVYILVLKI